VQSQVSIDLQERRYCAVFASLFGKNTVI